MSDFDEPYPLPTNLRLVTPPPPTPMSERGARPVSPPSEQPASEQPMPQRPPPRPNDSRGSTAAT